MSTELESKELNAMESNSIPSTFSGVKKRSGSRKWWWRTLMLVGTLGCGYFLATFTAAQQTQIARGPGRYPLATYPTTNPPAYHQVYPQSGITWVGPPQLAATTLANQTVYSPTGTTPAFTGPSLPSQVTPKQVTPEEQAATNEINKLLDELRTASGDKQAEMRTRLVASTAKIFDLRHADQTKQIEKLERELDDAKALHKRRGERKDEIVDRRVAELLNAPDELTWDSSPRSLRAGSQNLPTYVPLSSSIPTTYYSAPGAFTPPGTPASQFATPYYGSQPASSPQYFPQSTSPTQRWAPANPLLTPQEAGQHWASHNELQKLQKLESELLQEVGESHPTVKTLRERMRIISEQLKRLDAAAGARKTIPSTAPSTANLSSEPVSDANATTAKPAANNRAIIEAGYAYIEALQDFSIRTKSDFAFEGSKANLLRQIDKCRTIWEAEISALTSHKEQLMLTSKVERDVEQYLETLEDKGASPISDLSKATFELEVTESKIRALDKQLEWAEEFEKNSISPLVEKLKEESHNISDTPARDLNRVNEPAEPKTDR